MDAEGIQRIVITDFLFDHGNGKIAQDPEPRPMISDAGRLTKPAAGVMATRPATTPEAMPRTVGLPVTIHSQNIHTRAAVAAEVLVTRKADAATPSAASWLPALKPNQPNHSRAAPRAVRAMLEGNMASLP
jgi:hypothetical protein